MRDDCPVCGEWDVVTDAAAGDVVCRSCGSVICDHIPGDTVMAAAAEVEDSSHVRWVSTFAATLDSFDEPAESDQERAVRFLNNEPTKRKRDVFDAATKCTSTKVGILDAVQTLRTVLRFPMSVQDVATGAVTAADPDTIDSVLRAASPRKRGLVEHAAVAAAFCCLAAKQCGHALPLKDVSNALAVPVASIDRGCRALKTRVPSLVPPPRQVKRVDLVPELVPEPRLTALISHLLRSHNVTLHRRRVFVFSFKKRSCAVRAAPGCRLDDDDAVSCNEDAAIVDAALAGALLPPPS